MKRMLADVRPELINEWSQRNLPLTQDSVKHGTHKIVWLQITYIIGQKCELDCINLTFVDYYNIMSA